MAVNTENIEIGEGNLTLKFEGEAAAVDVGGCIDAELDIKIKDLDVEVGQYIDPIDSFDVSREITFDITLKEDTMRNFVTALGGDPADITDDVDKETYDLPGNSVNISKFAELIYTVPRVRNKAKVRQITLYKVKSKGGIKYSFKKDKEVQYKVSFKAYADSTHDGKPGKILKEKLA